MSDQLPDEPGEPEARALPVLWGLVSLVAVAVIVGGVLAVGASVATRMTGLAGGGGGESTAETTQRETLFLPEPSESSTPSSYITLPNVPEPRTPTSTFSEKPKPKTKITLVAGQKSVGQMENIDLTGTYAGGDGAVLQVQQFKEGGWSDFPVNVSVNGGQFTTFIQASMLGVNRFRVLDTDSDEASNEVRVTIS